MGTIVIYYITSFYFHIYIDISSSGRRAAGIVCVCVCARSRARARVCMCVCERERVCVRARVCRRARVRAGGRAGGRALKAIIIREAVSRNGIPKPKKSFGGPWYGFPRAATLRMAVKEQLQSKGIESLGEP